MNKKKYLDPEFEYIRIILSDSLCSSPPEDFKESGDDNDNPFGGSED